MVNASLFDMLTIRIGITDETTPADLDSYFTRVWYNQRRVSLIIDMGIFTSPVNVHTRHVVAIFQVCTEFTTTRTKV